MQGLTVTCLRIEDQNFKAEGSHALDRGGEIGIPTDEDKCVGFMFVSIRKHTTRDIDVGSLFFCLDDLNKGGRRIRVGHCFCGKQIEAFLNGEAGFFSRERLKIGRLACHPMGVVWIWLDSGGEITDLADFSLTSGESVGEGS